MFTLMTPEAVRSLISQRPGNLQTLVTQAVAQLYQVVETPYPVYFDQALNCARILARLLPFLMENSSTSASSPALLRLLWQRQRVPRGAHEDVEEQRAARRARRSSSDDSDDTGSAGGLLKPSSSAEDKAETTGGGEDKEDNKEEDKHEDEELEDEELEEEETEPLAVILVNSIFHLLFLPDFTIEDPNKDFNEQDVNTQAFKSALMWAPGVGCSEKTLANSSQYDWNRIEILRLMIAAFSDSLFQNPDSYDSCESLWLEVGTSPDVPYGEIVFCSLMNVVLGYDPIGYGLPYGKQFTNDSAFQLMEVSIQALIVLLDFGHPIAPLHAEGATGGDSVSYVDAHDEHAPGFNVFRKLLRGLDDPGQLNFVFRGFSRLLNNVHRAQTTFLPYGATQISIEQELMVLLWKCLEEIPAFMPFILKENQCDINELVVPVCFFLLQSRKDPAKLGMLYLCTFVLLKLSGERSFSVALNKPYKTQLPVDMPIFKGSHADLVIVTVHKLMVDGMDKLSSLYTCYLTIICNISPYCKTLCAAAAHKLVNLLELFTSPKVLFATDNNYTSVVMLLESLNNLVQYQYEGNFNLIFSILTRRRVFEWLNSFSVPPPLTAQPKEARGSQAGIDSVEQTSTEKQTSEKGVLKRKSGSEEDEDGDEEDGQPAISSVPTSVISVREEERAVNSTVEFSRKQEKEEGEQSQTNDISSGLDEQQNGVKGGNTDSERDVEEVEKSENATREKVASNSVPPPPPSSTSPPEPPQQPQPFVPSPEWVARVKKELPLHTIIRLLRYLVPLVEEAAATGKKMDELSVLGFIRRTTMVGILPVPHAIVIRKYQPNKFTSLWFTAFMWGVIFLHNQGAPRLFDGRGVRLFMVQGGDAVSRNGNT